MTMDMFDLWNYRPDTGYTEGNDLVCYKIAATDGDIGKVDQATYDTGDEAGYRDRLGGYYGETYRISTFTRPEKRGTAQP